MNHHGAPVEKPIQRAAEWQSLLGRATCGDCLALMQQLPNDSITLTLTDIPYGKVNRHSNGLRNLYKRDADTETFRLRPFIEECIRVTNGSIYVFCGTEQVSTLCHLLVKAGLTTRLCIWEKSNPSPMNGQYVWLSSVECCVFGKKRKAVFNEHCKGVVWRYPVPKNNYHPTPKPLALMERLITASSQPGDIVLDPCAGGGTTLVAARNTHRRFIGFDLNPQYVHTSNTRLQAD